MTDTHIRMPASWERKADSDGTYAIAMALFEVAHALQGLAEPLRSDHPLQGQTLTGIEQALSSIAVVLEESGRTPR